MSRFRNFPSWVWGIVLIVGAVLALAVVGWLGLRHQQKSVWNDARVECQEWALRLNERMIERRSEELRTREVIASSELPEPGAFEFDPGAGEDQLNLWRREEGRTEGGIPMSLLAGLKQLKKSPTEVAALTLAHEAVFLVPSFFTPRILEEIRKVSLEADLQIDHEDFQGKWREEELGREMIRSDTRDGFRVFQGEIYWVNPGVAGRWEIGGPEEIAKALEGHLEKERFGGHRWMGAAITMGDGRCGNPGEVLVRKAIRGGFLELGVIDKGGLEARWREQLSWVMTMIGLAVLAVLAGLWVMLLGLWKERKMAYAKSQFVASVTHELRAPVGSIRLMADSLEAGKVRAGKVEEFHRLMARESGRLSVLIENVMDLAKVEDGKRLIRVEEIELSGLVSEVSAMMSIQAREKEVTIVPSGEEVIVSADPVALRQILVNLIDNALKFSPKGGIVTVGWGGDWWLSVADQGPGVPMEIRDRIFERFYRGEDELCRQTKGVGIGLSLVKELVELHGGRVSVRTEEGAVFQLDFSGK